MGSEWVVRKIGSLGKVVTGKTPPTKDIENFGGPYPFITIPDLDGRRIIRTSERTLSEKGAQVMHTMLLPVGAVMMSCIATVGKCGMTDRPSFTNQQINSVIPGQDIDGSFLYYLFTQLGREMEAAGGGGSVYTNVSKSRFSEIEVTIPKSLAEQRRIAHILGTFDDKIELNRRMNATLEAMARALFQSWFVDFEPVRAKMDGRWRQGESLPGLPAAWWHLFPDRLVDSELGPIPKGWRVGTLGEVAELTIGGDWGEDEPFVGACEVICLRGVDIEKLHADGWSDAPRRWVTPGSVEKRLLADTDILVAGSGVGPTGRSQWAIPEIGMLWGLPVIYSNFCKRFRCRTSDYAIYLDRHFQIMRESGEIWEYTNGTSIPNLDAASLLSQKQILLPGERILSKFAYVVTPGIKKLFSKENRTLQNLRDFLISYYFFSSKGINDYGTC